jgi:hypothetical protein
VNLWPNPAGISNLSRQASKSNEGLPATAAAALRAVAVLSAAGMIFFCLAAPLHAQTHKSKVPIVGKLTGGNNKQAYSGKIRSLDLKQKILNVNALHGRENEIFPFKKNVRVEGLNGKRMGLKALKPGTTVLIYFDQKSGGRTIKNIVVLSSGTGQEEDKPAPSS